MISFKSYIVLSFVIHVPFSLKNAAAENAITNKEGLLPTTYSVQDGVNNTDPANSVCKPKPLNYADFSCTQNEFNVFCNLTCIPGTKFEDQTRVKMVQCKIGQNAWLPRGYEDCKPTSHCHIYLKSEGKAVCHDSRRERTVLQTCDISCANSGTKTYRCTEDNVWEPQLPDCVIPNRAPTKKAKKVKNSRETVEAKRERKAAKTLAIITGVFVICWLPFFVTALLMAVVQSWDPNPYLFSFFLWLGYVNSLLNPIIYTIFSPDFRIAFKKRVLCGRQHRKGLR